MQALGVKRVVVVGPVPMWLPSLPEVVTSQFWGQSIGHIRYGLIEGRADEDARMSARYAGAADMTYVPIIPRVCGTDGCQAAVPGSNPPELVAFDAGHLTPRGSAYIADLVLRPVLLGAFRPSVTQS